jgi:amidase
MSDARTAGCYMGGPLSLPGAAGGPLAGLTFVVKDSFDVAGEPTCNGNPTWRDTHPVPSAAAPAVQALLGAGARLVGKTVMDELGYSLAGENAHFGAPPNPACPGHTAGGSSSGAAAAVAAGDADFGLGGDTGGSVRVPASYCGILGFRPTHGRLPLGGYCPLAPSFDTAGLFARDPAVLRAAAAAVLLPCAPGAPPPPPLQRWLVGADAFALAEEAAGAAVYGALAARMAAVRAVLGAPREVQVGGGVCGGLEGWAEVFRVHQGHEAWALHGPWIRRHRPAFGPGIGDRFAAASAITGAELAEARAQRAQIAAHLDALLGTDGVLALPSAPGAAPALGAQSDAGRRRLIALTAVAGLAGLPQVSLPVAQVGGRPVGLGLVGPRGSDEAQLVLAEALLAALGGGGQGDGVER